MDLAFRGAHGPAGPGEADRIRKEASPIEHDTFLSNHRITSFLPQPESQGRQQYKRCTRVHVYRPFLLGKSQLVIAGAGISNPSGSCGSVRRPPSSGFPQRQSTNEQKK